MKDYSYIAALTVIAIIVVLVLSACGKHPAIQDREDRKAMSSVEE